MEGKAGRGESKGRSRRGGSWLVDTICLFDGEVACSAASQELALRLQAIQSAHEALHCGGSAPVQHEAEKTTQEKVQTI